MSGNQDVLDGFCVLRVSACLLGRDEISEGHMSGERDRTP